ncbi:MAG: LysR family transcriptional regulator [Clostridiales bacterium]|nr:LysR family transcriptional regulator [Clostridiales bacterium]
MNTAQLNYFLSAAKHLSFSEAAKEFYMTQPAISHQISDLEKELGAKLFSRTSRGVVLTKAGELFLEDAKQMLDMESLSRERLRSLDASGTIRLSIAYLASGSMKKSL